MKALNEEQINNLNILIDNTRTYYNEMGQFIKVNNYELSNNVVKKLLHCDGHVLNHLVNHGFLKCYFEDEKRYFLRTDIEDYAKDTSHYDKSRNLE